MNIRLWPSLFLAIVSAVLLWTCEPPLEDGFQRLLVVEGLNCGNLNITGNLVSGTAANGVRFTIPYSNTNGGSFSDYTVPSSGITGLAATLNGSTLSSGSGVLSFTVNGRPSSGGTAIFAIKFARASCVVQIPVTLPVGTITSLNCGGAEHSGNLISGVNYTIGSGISSSVPYSGSNGGTYSAIPATSTGVTGLTATVSGSNFSSGSGKLTYTITGTPSSAGTASFALNIGGQGCTLTRTVSLPVGTITGLNCAGASHLGNLITGRNYTTGSGISSLVPYSGGNGGTYNVPPVASTGVTGLTATVSGSNFMSGSGNLSYTITGTPSSAGTASFASNIGGRACTLTRMVNDPISMKNISAGTFAMGCTTGDSECDDDEFPVRSVTLSAFQISETEVTQAQWQAVTGSNPSEFNTCGDCPVERVSWFEAVVFCNRLSELEGLTPCYYSNSGLSQVFGKSGSSWTLPSSGTIFINSVAKGYRLPTEAEWEYAARGGNSSLIYSGSNLIGAVAWYSANSVNRSSPVRQKLANGYGLYDMSGNVWEWCEDWYANYTAGAQTNPKGPLTGTRRVVRGGGFSIKGTASECRVSKRIHDDPTGRYTDVGFRVARRL